MRHLGVLSLACVMVMGCDPAPTSVDAGARDASVDRDARPGVDASMEPDASAEPDAAMEPDASMEPDAAVTFCEPGATRDCYGGPPGTRDVGACMAGTETCLDDGSAFGACSGEVVPRSEDCATPEDDDCDGSANDGCACVPGSMDSCYVGPSGTVDMGICRAGTHECDASGTGYGPCVGQVLPVAETCATPVDDDCDGMVNEDGAECVCSPGSTSSCYTGPVGTAGVGRCVAGTSTCNSLGTASGACTGEVLPATESCATPVDDDCDGMVNEGCVTVSYATDVQPILAAHCGPCHTTGGSGGANLASSYSSTQLASYFCSGMTKGACSLVRVRDGSMPRGGGCTGNPTLDAARPQCLTASEQATLEAWIMGGQLP